MIETNQQQANKALHPTTYSLRFGCKLPSLRRWVILVVMQQHNNIVPLNLSLRPLCPL